MSSGLGTMGPMIQEVARTSVPEGGLTPFAAVFMTASIGLVTLLTAYVFYRILRGPAQYGESEEEE